MACEFFFDWLEARSGEAPSPAEQEALHRHLDGCASCRALAETLNSAPAADGAALVAGILRRTTGSACASARERLCAFVDGELGGVDDALVGTHVDACVDCEGLARALALLAVELPLLASADPGPSFVEGVLARTTRRPRPEPLGGRISRWMRPLLARPRIAVEGAFVATAMLVLPIVTPGSPFGFLPQKALGLAKEAVPAQRIAAGRVRGMIDEVEMRIDAADPAVAMSALRDGGRRTWDALQHKLGTFTQRAASEQAGHGNEASRDPKDAQENR